MNDFQGGYITGVIVCAFICFLLWNITNSKTAFGWCEDIALNDTTMPYQASYDKCIAEWEQRKK